MCSIPIEKKGFVSFSGLIIDHYSQKCWVTNFPTLTPPWNRGEKVKEFKIFNLVGNGHVSIISNELFERKYYVSGFIFFLISNMRIFVFYHTGPEKYPRNITPYKIITLQNIIGKLPEIWWITSWQPSSKKRTCSHLLWTAILELRIRPLTLQT